MNHFDSEQEKVEVKSELESYASAEVYLSTMAHELKSPFSEIEVLARFLREDSPDLSGEAEKRLGMIEDVCRRSKEAIGHFLELAHIGSAEINRSVIPMTDLVRECFQSLIKKQEGSSVKLEMEEMPSLIADEVLIRHMVKNILSNSIKYSAKVEKPVIRVSSYSEDSWYCYSFQDNGIGFDAHYASQVFTVFQRLHSSDEYEGSGVGLATVKRIAERFDGSVEIFGKQNKGCTMVVKFPRNLVVLPENEKELNSRKKDRILVGILHADTGLYASGCRQNRLAYELAAREINEAGGIAGKQVELLFRDFACDPDLAEKQTWELAEVEKVDLLLGGYLSNVRERVRPIASQKKLLYFYNSQYEGGVADHNTFCLSAVPDQNIIPIIDYLGRKVGKRVYLIITDYNYGILTAEYVKHYVQSVGGEIAGVEYLLPEKNNYGVTIENIIQSKPDYLFTVFMGAYQNEFFRQWHEKGIPGMPVISTTGISIFYLHKLFPAPVMQDIYFMNSYLEVMNTPEAKAFTEKLHAMMPGKEKDYIDFDCETAYVSLYLYKKAVEMAGSTQTEAVIKALESGQICVDGPGGHVRVRGEDHGTVRDFSLFHVNSWHEIEELAAYRGLYSHYVEDIIEKDTGLKGGLARLGRHTPNVHYSPIFRKV